MQKPWGWRRHSTFEELNAGQRVRRSWVLSGPDDARGGERLHRSLETLQGVCSFSRAMRYPWSILRKDAAGLKFALAAGRVQTREAENR